MKKITLLAVGSIALLSWQSASAQYATNVLFSTSSDFTGWTSANGSTVGATTAVDFDGNTINGLGNNPGNSGASINPGASSSGGSLSITYASGVGSFNSIANAPGEAYNTYFMNVFDPGSTAAFSAASGYGPGSTVAYSGTLQMLYTAPDNNAGSYYQLGILLQYAANNYYSTFFPSSVTDLGAVAINDPDNLLSSEELYLATIPYTIDAGTGNFGGLGFSIMYNSDYNPTQPFYVDQIQVLNPVPEPAAMALIGMGALGFAAMARRRQA